MSHQHSRWKQGLKRLSACDGNRQQYDFVTIQVNSLKEERLMMKHILSLLLAAVALVGVHSFAVHTPVFGAQVRVKIMLMLNLVGQLILTVVFQSRL
jgi:hypothetical protein